MRSSEKFTSNWWSTKEWKFKSWGTHWKNREVFQPTLNKSLQEGSRPLMTDKDACLLKKAFLTHPLKTQSPNSYTVMIDNIWIVTHLEVQLMTLSVSGMTPSQTLQAMITTWTCQMPPQDATTIARLTTLRHLFRDQMDHAIWLHTLANGLIS